MHEMRGVANQSEPFADEFARYAKTQRERFDARGDLDGAELQRETALQLLQEILRSEREQRLGVGRALVPDDARPAAGQRQDRERSRRQEVLLGAAMVVTPVRDRGDEAGLSCLPADGRNVRERAEFRARTVRRDDEASAEASTIREVDPRDFAPRP